MLSTEFSQVVYGNQVKIFPHKDISPYISSHSTEPTCYSEWNFHSICIFPPKNDICTYLTQVSMQTFPIIPLLIVQRERAQSFASTVLWEAFSASETSITTLINLHENCSCRQIPVQLHVPPHIILASLFLKRLLPKYLNMTLHDSDWLPPRLKVEQKYPISSLKHSIP